MLRLHQTFGAHAGRVREIDQDVVRFGRLPTNDFAFDPHADLDASGNHAEIRREGAKWILLDVGSRNGTLLNGRPVQRAALEGGEEIEFGTGGPRVRIEIVRGGRGMPTAPATPITPDASAPTALAPGHGSKRPHSPGPPPAIAPPGQIPTPVWPAPSKPVGASHSPAPLQSLPSGSPKLYGQRTMEQLISSAVSQAQSGYPPNVGGAKAHDTGYIRQVAEEAASHRSRAMMFVLVLVLVLFALTMCVLSGIVAILWAQGAH